MTDALELRRPSGKEVEWEPTEMDIARMVAVISHMSLLNVPPKDESEIVHRLLYALQRLDIRLVDSALPLQESKAADD